MVGKTTQSPTTISNTKRLRLSYKTNTPTARSTMAIEPLSMVLLLALLEFEPAADPVWAGPEPVIEALFPEKEPVETVEDVAEALLETLLIVSEI